MLPSLEGVLIKLKRANQQIESFNGEVGAFLDGRPYEPIVKFSRVLRATQAPHVLSYIVRIAVKEPPPPIWSVLIGEIIHNLRSAMDHLVYQLVIYNTNTVPPIEGKTQFPVFITPDGFKARGKPQYLKGVGANAAALIETMQPFSCGEGASSPLWHLAQLSNIDKHRTIHLTGGTMHAFNVEFPPLVTEARYVESSRKGAGAFQHNTMLIDGVILSNIPPFGSSGKVDVNVNIHFDIVFDERTPLVGGWVVTSTLRNIADRCRDAVAGIAKDILGVDVEV